MRILASVLLFIVSSSTLGQAQGLMSMHIQRFHAEGYGPSGLIRQIAQHANITIGVEMDAVLIRQHSIEFDFPGGTVSDLVAQIDTLLPGVAWRVVRDNSLLFYNVGEAAALGSIQIDYPGFSNVSRYQIWANLSDRAEINQWLSSNGCKRFEVLSNHEWRGDKPTVTIPAGLISLTDLLAISAANSNSHSWSILRNTRDGTCEISLTIW